MSPIEKFFVYGGFAVAAVVVTSAIAAPGYGNMGARGPSSFELSARLSAAPTPDPALSCAAPASASTAVTCEITVVVYPIGSKRCIITGVNPAVLILPSPASAPNLTVHWTLVADAEAGGMSASDAGLSFHTKQRGGIDVAGDPDNTHFNPPSPGASTASGVVLTYSVTRAASAASGVAIGYNVTVDRLNSNNKLVRCHTIDPLIVNRD